jgi:hypothetical protein
MINSSRDRDGKMKEHSQVDKMGQIYAGFNPEVSLEAMSRMDWHLGKPIFVRRYMLKRTRQIMTKVSMTSSL